MIWADMGNVEYYREQARRCSDLAVTALNSDIARRWHELAAEYIALAEQQEERAPLIDLQSQRQQQQQSKDKSVR
jgi:hypothetical protein